MQAPSPWHDHLIPALPGVGYSSALRVVVLRYTQSYADSLDFKPVTTLSELAAAKLAGRFTPIPGTADQYELAKNDVLVCPVVR